jgi:hypothetical protein
MLVGRLGSWPPAVFTRSEIKLASGSRAEYGKDTPVSQSSPFGLIRKGKRLAEVAEATGPARLGAEYLMLLE